MQLGIGTYTYGWSIGAEKNNMPYAMDENDLLDKAKQFRINLLQIGDNLPLHDWSEERLNLFENALRENKVTPEIGARGLKEDHLIKYIGLCKRYDARILRFIIDDENYRPSVSQVVAIIKAHIDLLEENNVTLAIENHDRFKSAEYATIIEKAGSEHAGICLDTVNSMGAGEGIETITNILAPFTVNLHIKDFGISRLPHKQGFIIEGRIAGEGMLDMPSLLNKLNQYGLCHTCIVEQWVPPEKERSMTLRKEQQWAERSVEYLQKILN